MCKNKINIILKSMQLGFYQNYVTLSHVLSPKNKIYAQYAYVKNM